jgi:uncharacterized cupin superfamily protein
MPPPVAVVAADVAPRATRSSYPEIFAVTMQGRDKRTLGDLFGLTGFGVNLTRLAPGARSSIRHAHSVQDEIVYILEGRPTLVSDAGSTSLKPGMCAGFRGGSGDAHHLVNEAGEDVVYLEMGDRRPGDGAVYPDDDLVAQSVEGGWRYTHKDGSPY